MRVVNGEEIYPSFSTVEAGCSRVRENRKLSNSVERCHGVVQITRRVLELSGRRNGLCADSRNTKERRVQFPWPVMVERGTMQKRSTGVDVTGGSGPWFIPCEPMTKDEGLPLVTGVTASGVLTMHRPRECAMQTKTQETWQGVRRPPSLGAARDSPSQCAFLFHPDALRSTPSLATIPAKREGWPLSYQHPSPPLLPAPFATHPAPSGDPPSDSSDLPPIPPH